MALSLERRKQNAKAFELVFHEERVAGQLRQGGEDRVQQTVAQAQDRFGNLRLAGALELGSSLAAPGFGTDAAHVAGDVGFLSDQLVLSLAGFDTGLLGPDASNAAVIDAMGVGAAGAAGVDGAMRDAEATDYDATHPAVRNLGTRGGQSLPSAVQARMGAAFGHDFSHVRVHTDGAAAQAAEALNARAFAIGAEIWFGRGAYNPGTSEGDRVLAHELTHVVQHDEGRLPSAQGEGLNVSSPTDSAETEAYANEHSIVASLGTSSTTGLGDAPLAGEAQAESSPDIVGVSLPSGAASATEAEAGSSAGVEGIAMRDSLGKRRSRGLPGANFEQEERELLAAGVDPTKLPAQDGPGLDGEVKAPRELLAAAARNVPGLSGALKPADMDVVDRGGNRPQGLIDGLGVGANFKVGGVSVNANVGANGVGVNASADLGNGNRANLRAALGADGANVAANASLADGAVSVAGNQDGVNLRADLGDVKVAGTAGADGAHLDAALKTPAGDVRAALEGGGVKLDAALGDKDKKKKGEGEEEEEGEGKDKKKGGDKEKAAKKGGPGGEATKGEGGPKGKGKDGVKGEGVGGEGAPGLGGPLQEGMAGVAGLVGGPGVGGAGPLGARALGVLQLPGFQLKKDEEAGLKEKTGLTPEQHQASIRQHVDRIRQQVDDMRVGLERYAVEKAAALDLEVRAVRDALAGDVSTAKGKISGAYAGARGGLAAAATEAMASIDGSARAAREKLATSLPAQQGRLKDMITTGRTKVDGLGEPWKKKFTTALDDGAKGLEKAGADCAKELAAGKDAIVNAWPDAGDALVRAENEARRKAASKGVDDAVADFRAGGMQKGAAARGQAATYHQQVDTALQAVRDALTAMETEGKTQLQGAHDRALTTITTQTTEASTAITGAKERATQALGSAETAALGEVDQVQTQQGESLSSAGENAKSSINGASGQLRERYAQWFDGVLRGIPEKQATTYDQVKEFLEGKERELPTFNAQIMGELDKSCEGARDMVVQASDAARAALTRLADGQAQSAANQGRQQADGIRATARQFGVGITATGSAVETAFTQHVQPMQGRVDQRLTLAEGQLTTALENAKTQLAAQATQYAAQLRERIQRMPATLAPMANAAARGVYANLSNRAQQVHSACKGMGTNENQVYNALRGLTAIGGAALEQVVWGRLFRAEGSLRAFLDDDLNDDEKAIAFAYLGGNTALGARLELDASMHWYGDDEAQIERILRELSPEDLAAMKADPQWAATRARLVDNLGGTDLDVTRALIAGNVARADAYRLREKIDEARRSQDPDALADALAGVDPAQLAAVQQEFVNIQNRVDPEATNVPPVDPQVAAAGLADYATRDIETYDPNTGGMQTDRITGANRDLVRSLAMQGRDSTEAATARFEVERTRSGGPNMERMEQALMAPADLQARLHNPDPQIRAQALQEQDRREQTMRAMYQAQYGGPNGRTMDQAIDGMYAGKNDQDTQTRRRLMSNMLADGTNSPRVAADMIAVAADGAGTDEAMIKRALTGMRPDEVQQMDQVYRQVHGGSVYERLGVAERDANGNKIPGRDHAANQWFNELSGDDRREVEMLLQGDPQYMSTQQQLALARSQYDWQRGSEAGMLSGSMNGSAEAQDLERNYANLQSMSARMRPDGTFANPEDQREFERLCGDVGINAAQYQAATDRVANYVTTTIAVVGAVVVTAATFGSGAPAGAAMIMAATGTAASGALSMAANSAMKGGRYGWEQAATDAGVTAVSTLTAGAGAYLKGAQVGVQSLGKLGSGIAIDGGMGLINGGAQTAMTDGTWDKGFWHGMGQVGVGAGRQALTDMANAAVSGKIDDSAFGQAIEQSGSIWRTAVFKGASNAAGSTASTLTGVAFDSLRGKGPTDLSSVAETVGTEGAKQFVMGAGGGALGAGIRRSRAGTTTPAPDPAQQRDNDSPPPPPAGGAGQDGPNRPPNDGGGTPAPDSGTPTPAHVTDGATNTPPSAPRTNPDVDPATGRPVAGAQQDAGTAAAQRDSTGGQGGRSDTDVTVVRDQNTGETTVTGPKGVTRADDSGVVTHNRDGTTDFIDRDGNLTHITPDGTTRTVLTDGTIVVRDADGTAVAVKDGDAIRLDAQGKPMREDGNPRTADDSAREQAVFDRVDQLVQQGKMSHEQAWAIVARSGDANGQERALRGAEGRIAQDDVVVDRLVTLSRQVGPDGAPLVQPRDLDGVIDAADPMKALQVLESRVANRQNDTQVSQNIAASTRADATGGAFVDDVFDNITVGAGFAGISNEVGARANGAQGKRLVVGGENPWLKANADLGQRAGESEVGGGSRSMASTSDSASAPFMKARQHAENVEVNRAEAGVGVLNAKIDGVELRSQMPEGTTWHKDAAARIRVHDGVNADGTPKFKYIYANHVDIASGAGPARELSTRPGPDGKPAQVDPDLYQQLKRDGRILQSDQGFDGARIREGEKVAVYGAGASGAWGVEGSYKNAGEIEWLGRMARPSDDMPPSQKARLEGMYDSLARARTSGDQVAAQRAMQDIERFTFTEARGNGFLPRNQRPGAAFDPTLQSDAGGKVTRSVTDDVKSVTFETNPANGQKQLRIVGADGTEVWADRLVLAIGQDGEAAGGPGQLLGQIKGMTPLVDTSGREWPFPVVVGVESGDGAVRVIGAAATSPSVRKRIETGFRDTVDENFQLQATHQSVPTDSSGVVGSFHHAERMIRQANQDTLVRLAKADAPTQERILGMHDDAWLQKSLVDNERTRTAPVVPTAPKQDGSPGSGPRSGPDVPTQTVRPDGAPDVTVRTNDPADQGAQGPKASPGPDLTEAPQGRQVTQPRPGETPLIGLHSDFYDPKASADTLRAQLALEGVPRQQKLSASERLVESHFANWVQQNARAASDGALKLAQAAGSADQPIFEVDGMKRLVPEYGAGGKPANAEEFKFRLENNHALHPAAVAVARLAFVERLDVLAALPDGHPQKQVFVTNGGCAAGKGSLTGIVKDALGDKATFGAVWDAAGEGDALENGWILKAAQQRGLKVVYGYAEADPTTRYQGVLNRAEGSGRVVDVMTFVNSYSDGADSFRRFLDSPEYKQAVADGHAAAFGISPGEFDPASLKDKSKPAFPDLKNLNPDGSLRAQDVSDPPNKQAALDASLRILEDYVAKQRAAGKDPDAVARGALENAIKFLDNQPPDVRAAVLASYARIFGAAPSGATGGGTATGPGTETKTTTSGADVQTPQSAAGGNPVAAAKSGDAGSTVGPRLTAPEPGRAVTAPKPGDTPLIGLATDFYDPKASAEAMTRQLGETGVARQPKLNPSERAAETGFADWVQQNPAKAKDAALALANGIGSADQPIFEVDAMKRLVPEYGAGSKPADATERQYRLENNHALHPAAVAVARLAFMERLDVLQQLPDGHPSKQVFVTSGGCAAGKGDLTGIVKDALGDKAKFGAVWDAAGEGDALENSWILKAAQARGLKVVFGYAEADPTTRYQSVLERAQGSGRVVDVMTFINSYVDGAAEMKRFMSSDEYKTAAAKGDVAAFGIAPGEFNRASLTDKSQKAYPDVKPLNPAGAFEAQHVGAPPNKQQALEASLKILEDFVAKERAAGKDPSAVAKGALENAIKFIDDQPPEIRQAVLGSYARIFGVPVETAPPMASQASQVGPSLTTPDTRHSVTAPRPGDTPLIGIATDFFDPKASAEAMTQQLGEQGVARQPKLSGAERTAEKGFADWVQANPQSAKESALRLAEGIGNADQPIFEVDAMKRLVPEYGAGSKPADDVQRQYRLEMNHALHPTAVAVARLAFMERLDVLQKLADDHPLKQVFVTSGGCAAGKGDLTGIVKSALGEKATFGAVWDAAGEGDALENGWILKAAQARGIKVVFGYAEADPTTRYQSVLERAQGSGRVVDVMTFINSYVDGATEMKRFMSSDEYKAAVAGKQASAFGIAPGEFNRASLTDKSQKAYPDVKPLNATGAFEAQHVGGAPDRQKALEASLKILEDFVSRERAAGKDPNAVARGALENALKFLDTQPPEVRQAVLASYARIFGGSDSAMAPRSTGAEPAADGARPAAPEAATRTAAGVGQAEQLLGLEAAKVGDPVKLTAEEIKKGLADVPVSGAPFAKGAAGGAEVDPHHVQQGGLGDCWFMAGLAAVARANPAAIKNRIKDNGDGTYEVHLFIDKNGRLGPPGTKVTVDGAFPHNGRGKPEYAQIQGYKGKGDAQSDAILWPALMERGLAQILGSYPAAESKTIITGLESVGGGKASLVVPDRVQPARLLEDMDSAIAAGKAIVACTHGKLPDDVKATLPQYLVAGHAYVIASVDKAKQTVTLQNPWGAAYAVKDLPIATFQKVFVNLSTTQVQ